MRRLYYSDDDFGQQFRDALGDYKEVPPRGNWKKINARLEKRKLRRYTGWIGGMAAMLTVVILGVSINISTKNARLRNEALKQQAAKLKIEQRNKSVLETRDNARTTKPFATSNPKVEKAQATSAENALVKTSVATSTSTAVSMQRVETNPEQAVKVFNGASERAANESVAAVKTLEAHSVESLLPSHLITAFADEPIYVNDLKPLNEPCYDFYVGLAVQPQHHIFYSENAVHDRRMNYKFSPGYALGFTAGYNVFNKLSVESGGMWSVENQNYEFVKTQSKKPTVATHDANKTSIGLTYVRVPLLVKYKMRWSGYESSCFNSINVLGGVQYGRFFGGSSESQIDYELTDETIKKNDLQVMLGAERSQRIARNFTLNYGLRFGYGVKHMASGHSQRVNTLYKPHNLLAAVNMSLNLHK